MQLPQNNLASMCSRTDVAPFMIAHIADPHINMDLHPDRLLHLRELLTQSIRQGASHIVISGDIASVPNVSYWIAVRTMLQELGIYRRDLLSLVIGNHDIFGGPHSTSELIRFPRTCWKTDVENNIRVFESVFSELFRDTLHPADSAFPYVKVVGSYAFIGINTVAPFSLKHNPCASNGDVSQHDIAWIEGQMSQLPAYHNVAIMHHHLQNHKPEFLKNRARLRRVLYWMEDKTLKLHNHTQLVTLFRKLAVGAVLHGHVHVSAKYDIENIVCSNAGGSILPMPGSRGPSYNILDNQAGQFQVRIVEMTAKEAETTTVLSQERSPNRTWAPSKMQESITL
jgi:predicted phosphodiesterase